MAKGYMGKLLWVDLTSGKVSTTVLDEATAQGYLGGSGLGAKLGIDATKPLAKEFPPLVESPQEVMEMVEAQWDSYGI